MEHEERKNILDEIRVEIENLTTEDVRASLEALMERKRRRMGGIPQGTPDFVVSTDEYMGCGQEMYPFYGTFRALLESLTWASPDPLEADDVFELNGRTIRRVCDMTDDELVKWFDDANGDGQPYVMVFDVKAGRKVLG